MATVNEESVKIEIDVTLFGQFSMRVGEQIISDDLNRAHKIWNILSYLIINRDRQVAQMDLIEQFWTEDSDINPTNALKTLLYRIRGILEPYFGEEINPIISRRGSYAWNPNIICNVDCECFTDLIAEAEKTTTKACKKIQYYKEAINLFQGEFLPKLSDSMWVIPLNAHYHALYISAVKKLSELLEENGEYDYISQICMRAVEIEPLDDYLYTLLVRALSRQGKHSVAITYYESATERLYRDLGVSPSKKLRTLYDELMITENALETDLKTIQEQLCETGLNTGPFFCEYGYFRESYRLEARRCMRAGICVHLGLLTLSLGDGKNPDLEIINRAMDQLQVILQKSLRSGDVVAKYSGAQYVIMLPSSNFEDSTMVMERIVSRFYSKRRRNALCLTYKVRELELN